MDRFLNCPYCQRPAELVTGEAIYPYRHDLRHMKFWRCKPCDAYVGCHRNGATVDGITSDGTLPLGTLANEELRHARSEVHAAFDPLWKVMGWKRRIAYAALADLMNMYSDECHIGRMDLAQCKRAIDASFALQGKARIVLRRERLVEKE